MRWQDGIDAEGKMNRVRKKEEGRGRRRGEKDKQGRRKEERRLTTAPRFF